MRALEAAAIDHPLITEALDRRLDPDSPALVAVAVSGGGDSLAALIATRAWAERRGRPVLALSVDHDLQAGSAGWTAFAGEAAARLGCGFQALRWEGPKPGRGLPAAARAARHRLIAEAAREAGASVVVFGHTADDLLEGRLMRAEGSSVGDPAEWAPSPVWPEGRGVFLLRPLLGVRRAAIREALAADGWSWVDDPANEDVRSARARARQTLLSPPPRWGRVGWGWGAGDGAKVRDGLRSPTAFITPTSERAPPPNPPPSRGRAFLGSVQLDRDISKHLLAAALLSVSGRERLPRGDRLDALLAKLHGPDPFTATLAGCRIEAAAHITLHRDAGELSRGGLAPLALQPGTPAVWDGRFEIETDFPGLTVRALKGLAARLPRAERQALKAVPTLARPSLPVVVNDSETLSCPILAEASPVRVRPLAWGRLLAACGAFGDEAAVREGWADGAHGGNAVGALSWGLMAGGPEGARGR